MVCFQYGMGGNDIVFTVPWWQVWAACSWPCSWPTSISRKTQTRYAPSPPSPFTHTHARTHAHAPTLAPPPYTMAYGGTRTHTHAYQVLAAVARTNTSMRGYYYYIILCRLVLRRSLRSKTMKLSRRQTRKTRRGGNIIWLTLPGPSPRPCHTVPTRHAIQRKTPRVRRSVPMTLENRFYRL